MLWILDKKNWGFYYRIVRVLLRKHAIKKSRKIKFVDSWVLFLMLTFIFDELYHKRFNYAFSNDVTVYSYVGVKLETWFSRILICFLILLNSSKIHKEKINHQNFDKLFTNNFNIVLLSKYFDFLSTFKKNQHNFFNKNGIKIPLDNFVLDDFRGSLKKIRNNSVKSCGTRTLCKITLIWVIKINQ